MTQSLRTCIANKTDELNFKVATALAESQDALLLLDPRSFLPEASLNLLVDAARTKPQCLIGCRTVESSQPQRTQLPGWRWSPSEGRWTSEWVIELKEDSSALAIRTCEALSPEAVVIPYQAWTRVGPFDVNLTLKHAIFDWCRRAHAAGFACYEVRSAHVLIENPHIRNYDAKVQAYLNALPDTLHIAKKHGLPLPRFRLIAELLGQAITEEISRVRFGANYGFPVSTSKRTLWYLRNVLKALTRDRILSTLRYAALSYLRGLRSQTDR